MLAPTASLTAAGTTTPDAATVAAATLDADTLAKNGSLSEPVPPFEIDGDRAIERVSLSSEGTEVLGFASSASLSADGRFVAFSDTAGGLVEGDTNRESDIFVRDRLTNTTERISIANDGSENTRPAYNPRISSDGRYVVFESVTNDLDDTTIEAASGIFLYDRTSKTVERVALDSEGNVGMGAASNADISADSRYVVFQSAASNLVADDTNEENDIFVRDLLNKTTERISIGLDDQQSDGSSGSPALSADGRYIAFASSASNLVEDDTNNSGDVFVYDRETKSIERVSVDSEGLEGNRFSNAPHISADGRYVSYSSAATNLVEGDTNGVGDVFVRDRLNQTTERISLASSGEQSNGFSFSHGISAGGRYVSYSSVATNLADSDVNRARDVFVYDRTTQTAQLISRNEAGIEGNSESRESVFSADGRFIAFQSSASNLVGDDTNGRTDIFVYAGDFSEDVDEEDPGVTPVLGTEGQTAENRIINLTQAASSTVTASIEVFRDAGYDNMVGFYVVEDAAGRVTDPLTGTVLAPEDVGYAKAAIAQRIDMTLTGVNGETTTYTSEMLTGSLLSTFIISNGTVDALLDADAANDPAVFFSQLGANSDRTDHVRLLGDNTFGYEDLIGGGDMDFNDMVVKVSFA